MIVRITIVLVFGFVGYLVAGGPGLFVLAAAALTIPGR